MRRFLLLALLLVGWAMPASAEIAGKRPHVIDAASFELLGVRVRLLGLAAPPPDQGCFAGGQRWNCGQAARWALAERIGLNWVVCEPRGHDASGAVVGLCALGGRGGPELNRWMVSRGWALARPGESAAYGAEEAAARRAGLGIWRGGFEPPAAWRRP